MAANNITNNQQHHHDDHDHDDHDHDDWVIIECTDPTTSPQSNASDSIFISTAQISSWDLPSILNFSTLQIKINRSMLIQQSSYFRSLLTGNFSESSMYCISIQWSLEAFLHILRFMHGCHMEYTTHSFLPLCHAAMYFGLERLELECRNWFSDIVMKGGLSSQLNLDELIHFWEFGSDNEPSDDAAVDWISGLCIDYVARNFMWALSSEIFVDLPYRVLVSCVKHSHLTVDSERHLCKALLAWLCANMERLEQSRSAEDGGNDKFKQMIIIKHDWISILEEAHVSLLPLWFIMGNSKCQYFSVVAKEGIVTITNILKKLSKDTNYIEDVSGQKNMRIRLSQYSKKIDLSGCPQITSSALLLSVLHQTTVGPFSLEDIGRRSIDLQYPKWISSLPTISFKEMVEVDISKCSLLHLGAAMECFRKSFPFLRTLRMAYFLDFETKNLCKLMDNYSSVSEIDLTVDVSPLLSSNISVLYSESLSRPSLKKYVDMPSCSGRRPSVSNITKLTLEGRSDFSDLELHHIAEFCISLCYLNIKGCSSVTDVGISNLLMKCRKLHSIIASDTSFGRNSASALCSRVVDDEHPPIDKDNRHVEVSDHYLQELHIGGCKGVSQTSLACILSCGQMLKNLCLRDTALVDQMLYRFPGSSLETLDISNTMVSRDALLHVLIKNPGLRYLEAKGCKDLCLAQFKHEEESLSSCDKLFSVLGRECKLEELSIGWGFSFFSLHSLGSALKSLKSINVGLGGSLGQEGLTLLHTQCPLLESVTILFQVISDTVIVNLLEALKNLKALSVCYCMGDLSSLSLKHSLPNLRKLKLERVTPWMTDNDLALLTRNCANLIELSLAGCTHLGVDSQQIISSGWPGLICLHLEDCGAVTENGTSFIFDCIALEDLLLRHNGPGIQKSFILDAASRLPMLRSISLDWCDASEGDFDLPNFADKYSLSNVKISRCKLRKCSLDFQNVKAQKRPVHKETLVLVWNSTSLQRTVVEERIT